jgi:hypothetical protein
MSENQSNEGFLCFKNGKKINSQYSISDHPMTMTQRIASVSSEVHEMNLMFIPKKIVSCFQPFKFDIKTIILHSFAFSEKHS